MNQIQIVPSNFDHLFESINAVCPKCCRSKQLNKVNNLVVCEACGWYTITRKIGGIKTSYKKLKN